MALDIHKLVKGKVGDLLFSIEDGDLKVLHGAFDSFKNKTGIFVDPYGDTKFTSGYNILIESIEESNISNNNIFTIIISILKEANDSNHFLIFVGD